MHNFISLSNVIKVLAFLFPMLYSIFLCIIFSLYSGLHLSLHSYSLNPPLSIIPLVTNSLFSLCLLLCCYIQSFVSFFSIPYISDIIQYLSFCISLISFSIMPSKSIHGVVHFTFLWLTRIPLICV